MLLDILQAVKQYYLFDLYSILILYQAEIKCMIIYVRCTSAILFYI